MEVELQAKKVVGEDPDLVHSRWLVQEAKSLATYIPHAIEKSNANLDEFHPAVGGIFRI